MLNKKNEWFLFFLSRGNIRKIIYIVQGRGGGLYQPFKKKEKYFWGGAQLKKCKNL